MRLALRILRPHSLTLTLTVSLFFFFFARFFLSAAVDSRTVKGKAGPDKARSPCIGEA